MIHRILPRRALCAALLLPLAGAANAAESSYLTPENGVKFSPVINAGEAAGNGYQMVGLPDGLGAFDNEDGTFTLFMNHEIGSDKGIERAHGGIGAFVSRWVIDKASLAVRSGGDLVASPDDMRTWNGSAWVAGTTIVNRLCSADLPEKEAFRFKKQGYDGRIFMNGEESTDGHAFAWIASGKEAGKAYELPYLGRLAWENAVANPYPQAKTIVMGMDDDGTSDSQVYVYVGKKQKSGNAVEKAGLHKGKLYGLKVENAVQTEDAENAFGGVIHRFSLVDLGQVAGKSDVDLETDGMAKGVSNFRRVEDGAWSPQDLRQYYFTTTADFASKSRLWRLTFDRVDQPEKGGVLELLLDGGDGVQTVKMLDNLAVDQDGTVLLQEDPGNQPYAAKVWRYSPADGKLALAAQADVSRFGNETTPATPPFTQDEESSGIIDVTHLFGDVRGYDTQRYRYFLLDVQAHKALQPNWTPDDVAEFIEEGQLLLMKMPK